MKISGFKKVRIGEVGNVSGYIAVDTDQESLLFSGHMDHVPPGETDGANVLVDWSMRS